MAAPPTEPRTLAGDLIEVGDVIRENRQLAGPETVIAVRGNTLVTDRGMLHASKAVLVQKVSVERATSSTIP